MKTATLKVMLEPGAYIPERAHPNDAGLDIRAKDSLTIPPYKHLLINTGVHVELPKGTAGTLKSKSGLMRDFGVITEGLIDEGYRGEIMVPVFNLSDLPFVINEGMKITQLVITPVLYPVVVTVEKIDTDTERGEDGFGSTGAY